MSHNWLHDQWEDAQDFVSDDLGLGAVDDFINDEIPGGYLGLAATGVGGYLAAGALGGAGAAGTAAGATGTATGLTAGQQALLIGGGSLASGYLGGEAAKESGRISAEATDRSLAESARQFDIGRADLAPYRQAGVNALAQYQGQLAPPGATQPEFQGGQRFNFDLESDPGYRFAVGEAERGVNRTAATMGKLGSGNRLAAVGDRITGVASQYANDAYNRQYGQNRENYGRGLTEFGLDVGRESDIYGRGQNYLNRLSGLAGVGQTATGQSGAAGSNYANSVSNILSANAANQANAANTRYGGINNAIQGGIGNYISYNQTQQLLGQNQQYLDQGSRINSTPILRSV